MTGHGFSRASTSAFSQQSTTAAGNSPCGNTPPFSSASNTFPASRALQNAIGHFRARLDGPQLCDFRDTTFKELCTQIYLIQKKQEAAKNMMNLQRIRGFLEAMEQFGKIVEVFLNCSNVIAFVWGPIKFLLMTASAWGDSFELLLEAYEDISECLPLLPEYEILFKDNPYLVEALELMYIDILSFHEHAMVFFSQKLWKQFVKSMWKTFKTRFDGILGSLKRHKEVLQSRASLAQYRVYRDDISQIQTKLDHRIEEERQKKKKAISKWLAEGQQQETDHSVYSQERLGSPNTANWILRNDFVKDWLDADIPATPIGWITGIPGAGKTILASAIIDECQRRHQTKPDPCLISFFYCRSEDQANNSAVGILAGLLNQLLHQYDAILPWCYNRYTNSGETSLRNLDRAKKLFKDCCTSVISDKFPSSDTKIFVILDGLDECVLTERNQILTFLMELVSECDRTDPGKLRIILASQDFADIHKALRPSGASRVVPRIVNISSGDNEPDICTYVTRQVKAMNDKYGPLEDKQQEYLTASTVRHADGMFLYAKLVTNNLLAQPTKGHFIACISQRSFPKDLQEAYARILHRIQTNYPSQWDMAKKLLGWMICAKRRLAWREIQVALSINVGDQRIDYELNHFREHIHDICGSLVVLSGDRVSLMHSTARVYLTKITEDIDEPSIECELATLCLQYLTFPCFDIEPTDSASDLQDYALQGHFAFQDYAVAKWPHHLNAFIDSGKEMRIASLEAPGLLDALAVSIEEFMWRYDENDWEANLVESCRTSCSAFKELPFYDSLVALASHIYTYQNKGFEARHKISIKSLDLALQRNRNILETLPKTLQPADLNKYRLFYDDTKRFKCTWITCWYFSEGFEKEGSRKKHVNTHERPFHCDVADCIGAEGFASQKDLEKHTKSFHPDASDLAESFTSIPVKRTNTDHTCSICQKTFTRRYHRVNHEKSHRGERPHQCGECVKAFTRLNDLKRHQKLHQRR